MLRCLCLLSSLALVFCCGMHAQAVSSARSATADMQAQAREAKVRELLQLMHLDVTYTQMTNQMMSTQQQEFEQLFPLASLNAAQRREYDQFMGRVRLLVMQSFSWQALEPEFVRIYARNFTDSDLDAILAFYHSPAGQDLIARTPDLLREASAMAMQRMTQVTPQLKAMMDEEIKKMASEDTPPAHGGARPQIKQ